MSSRRKKVEKRFSVNRRSSQRRAVEDLDKLWKGVHEEMRKKMKRRGRHDDNDSIEDEDEAPRTPEKPLDFLTARISASSPLADKRVLVLESRVLDEVEKNRRVRAECIQRESEMLKELELARKNATKELETARRMYEDKLRIESIRSEKRKEAALRSAEEKRKSDLALLRHELTEQMNRAIQETKQNMIMKTLLRRMSSVPESPVVVRGISTSPRGGSRLPTTKFERDTLKTWEQVVRRMLRSTITNNRSLYGAKIGSHEDGDFHEAFQAFDRDGNGRISLSELADAFRRLDLGLSEKQISIILKHADLDHNGTISYEEFANLVDPTRKSKAFSPEKMASKNKTLEELAESSPIVVKKKWNKEFGNPTQEDLQNYDFGPMRTHNNNIDDETVAEEEEKLKMNLNDEEDEEEEEGLLVPDEEDLKYGTHDSTTNSSIGLDPYGVEEHKNTENDLKNKIRDAKQEREKLRRTLSFEDAVDEDKNNKSLFCEVKENGRYQDDKDESFDPYRSAWWEQVNQELNDELDSVSEECESLRQRISSNSSRRSSRKKKSSSSRLNMNKVEFGDGKTLRDEKVWRANLRSPYKSSKSSRGRRNKNDLYFSSDSLHDDRVSRVHVSRRGSVQVTLKEEDNSVQEALPPIPSVDFDDDDDIFDDFPRKRTEFTPAWVSKLSMSARKKKKKNR